MKDVQAILFDMDGVLVNSEPVITEASILGLKEFGVQARWEDFHAFTGMGEDRFIGGVAELHGVPYRVEMKRRVYEIYLDIVKDKIEVYPGTLPTLTRLQGAGLRCALASAADLIKVRANLAAAGIAESLFAALVSGDDVPNKKPAPDVYLLAAQRCGVEPAHCVVVEDALSGIAAARAAGMRCVAVETSFPRERLLQAGADAVCKDISGVWEALEGLR